MLPAHIPVRTAGILQAVGTGFETAPLVQRSRKLTASTPAVPRLVFFLGPAAAGKSTLAGAWCRRQELAVQIELDEVRSMIVSGLVDPQSRSAAVSEQYVLAAKACCSLARTFLSAGYDVTIDDCETPEGFGAHWKPHLSGLRWTIVVVRPDLETLMDRNDSRGKTVRPDIIQAQYRDAGLWPADRTVDTTGLSVGASLDRVTELLSLKD